MPRSMAIAVALLVSAVAGCGREAPEDPAIAAPGAGIPVGAVGAAGVSFDAPTARPDPTPPPTPKGKHGKPPVGIGPSDPQPPDPFASPPDEAEPAPTPKGGPHRPKTHSPSETTL